MSQPVQQLHLIVDRLLDQSDFHVYMHPSKMDSLSLSDGSIVKIKSKNKYILASAVRGDNNLPISSIQMNRCLRINLSVYLGQPVTVESFTKCVPAECVTFAPIDDTVDGITGNLQDIFSANLASLPLTPNFVIPVFSLHRIIEFKVLACNPTNFVVVRDIETIIVKNQTVKRPEDTPRFDSICYDDIGGIEHQIRDLRAAIELPLIYPVIYDTLGIQTFRGILISAPSGCGKTMISHAIHNESPLYYERIQGYDFKARNAEDASCIMRKLAEMAIQKAPSIVFVDDLDLIIGDQYINGKPDKRLYLSFVAALDMMLLHPNIVVIGATKDLSLIPPPLKNVNRFGQIIEISLPGREKKTDIFLRKARGLKIDSDASNRIIDESKTGEDIESRVYEELISKALELTSNNHNDDREPIDLRELVSLEFGNSNSMPSPRGNGLNGNGSFDQFQQPQRDSFGYGFGYNGGSINSRKNNTGVNRGSTSFGNSNSTSSGAQQSSSFNNNDSSAKGTVNNRNSENLSFQRGGGGSGGIDPFSTTPANANPFAQNSNTISQSQNVQQTQSQPNSNQKNPFATMGRSDPFASQTSQQPTGADPFGTTPIKDPFSANSDQQNSTNQTIAADPFSSQQQQQQKHQGKKKQKKDVDPFATRNRK